MRLLSVAITLGALLACSPASPTEPDEAPAKEKSGKKKTKVGKKKPVASQVPCDVKVIIGANASLLEAPKAGSKRIAIVPKGSMGVLTAQRGNLVRFAEGWTPNEEETHYSTGWIDVTSITTELMSPLEYPGIAPVKLRKSPSAQAPSEELPELGTSPEVSVRGCNDIFLDVEVVLHKRDHFEGWLGPEDHCPSTVTNCN